MRCVQECGRRRLFSPQERIFRPLRIHRFHDGISRDLYVLYGRLSPSSAVARGVALQVLQETEVPSEILAALERPLEFYAAQNAEPEEESGD
jgi:hypothetical protein